jgi:hypothetical protein
MCKICSLLWKLYILTLCFSFLCYMHTVVVHSVGMLGECTHDGTGVNGVSMHGLGVQDVGVHCVCAQGVKTLRSNNVPLTLEGSKEGKAR